jgi:hypothetical protein
MSGLPKEAILSMLQKNIPQNIPDNGYNQHILFINKYLIPNIAEAIAANNEAILFSLKDD